MFSFRSTKSQMTAATPSLIGETQQTASAASDSAATPAKKRKVHTLSSNHNEGLQQKNKDTVTVVDGNLVFDNIPTPLKSNDGTHLGREDDELSLHTTESQDSIDAELIYRALSGEEAPDNSAVLSPKPKGKEEAEEVVELSMHVSQVNLDSKELPRSSSPSTASDQQEEEKSQKSATDLQPEASDNFDPDVLVNVSNSLLREDKLEDKKNTPTSEQSAKHKKSYWGFLRISMLVVAFVYMLNTKMTSTESQETVVPVIENEKQPTQAPSGPLLSVEEWMRKPVLRREEEQEQTSDDTTTTLMDALKVVGAMSFLVVLSLSKPSVSSDETADNQGSSSTGPTHARNSASGDILKSFDLSHYEKLKVVELRSLLRKRSCKTDGRKHVLICRLASVYKAELETLTVRQLRPILKSKGLKQAGLKAEIIQRLVENGM